MTYSVSRRASEIGIRMALGAQRADILRMVLKEGLRLAALGAVIGLVASFAVARLARGLLAGAPAWDARLIGVAALIMLAVSAAAAFIPARRAGAVDPIVVLINE
jgi:ABC-type antimicrobial peptide transport system permease subunit